MRDFLIHGGTQGALTREQWRANLNTGLAEVNKLWNRKCRGSVRSARRWDEAFLRTLTASPDLAAFDSWDDATVAESNGGNGAGE